MADEMSTLARVRAVQIDVATMEAIMDEVTQRMIARESTSRTWQGEGMGVVSWGKVGMGVPHQQALLQLWCCEIH